MPIKKDLKYPEKSDNNFVTTGCSITVNWKMKDAQSQCESQIEFFARNESIYEQSA